MNLQGKISQGVPIGNDVSFLLAEIVLAQVDPKLRVARNRAYRWFDDYEIACDSREEAEEILARVNLELGAFVSIRSKQTSMLRNTWFSILIHPLDSVANTPSPQVYFMPLGSCSSCDARTSAQARWLSALSRRPCLPNRVLPTARSRD